MRFLLVFYFIFLYNHVFSIDDTLKYNILWNKRIDYFDSATIVFKSDIFVNKKSVYLSYCSINNAYIKSFDTKNGDILLLSDKLNVKNTYFNVLSLKNLILANDFFNIYLINKRNLKTLIKYETPIGFSINNVGYIDNSIYSSIKSENNISENAWLTKSNINRLGLWDTLVKISIDTSGYSPYLYSDFNVFKNKLIFVQNRSFNFSNLDGKIDFFCFDIKNKEIKWQVNDLDSSGNSNVNAIYVNKNNVYFLGHHTIYAFDIVSGKKLWQYSISSSPSYNFLLGYANIQFSEEKLLLKTNGDLLVCLDINSGKELWKSVNSGSNPSKMKLYKNKLIYVANNTNSTKTSIHIIDVITGEILNRIQSPNENNILKKASFNCNQSFVVKKNKLYISDSYYLMCFSL